MTTVLTTFLLLFTLASGQVGPARNENRDAQSQTAECPGPYYNSQEVTVKPRITAKPNPVYTEEARRNGVSGRVVLGLVLCKTGSITDVEVIKGLPQGLSEQAVKAARRIKFEPGRKDDEPVSVKVRVLYDFQTY